MFKKHVEPIQNAHDNLSPQKWPLQCWEHIVQWKSRSNKKREQIQPEYRNPIDTETDAGLNTTEEERMWAVQKWLLKKRQSRSCQGREWGCRVCVCVCTCVAKDCYERVSRWEYFWPLWTQRCCSYKEAMLSKAIRLWFLWGNCLTRDHSLQDFLLLWRL